MSASSSDAPYPDETDVPTRHSLLDRARSSAADRRELCSRYAAPVYWWYRRALGRRPGAADEVLDLTHGFLARFFLEPECRFAEYLREPQPMRFLAYALAAARNYGHDRTRREGAQCRHGNGPRVELDADPARYEGLLEDPALTPDEAAARAEILDRLWRAGAAAVRELRTPPTGPLDRAVFDRLAPAGGDAFRIGPALTKGECRRLADEYGEFPAVVQKRWNDERVRRALIPYLTNPLPPFDELAPRLDLTPGALRGRFARLQKEHLHRPFRDELIGQLDHPTPDTVATEVARAFHILAEMTRSDEKSDETA